MHYIERMCLTMRQSNLKLILNHNDVEHIIRNCGEGIPLVDSLKELCFVDEPYIRLIKELDFNDWIKKKFPDEIKFIKLEFKKYIKAK